MEHDRPYNFTNREIEIGSLLLYDYSKKEIGDILHIRTETVRTHLKSLYRKTDTTGIQGVVVCIFRSPLIHVFVYRPDFTRLPAHLQRPLGYKVRHDR